MKEDGSSITYHNLPNRDECIVMAMTPVSLTGTILCVVMVSLLFADAMSGAGIDLLNTNRISALSVLPCSNMMEL